MIQTKKENGALPNWWHSIRHMTKESVPRDPHRRKNAKICRNGCMTHVHQSFWQRRSRFCASWPEAGAKNFVQLKKNWILFQKWLKRNIEEREFSAIMSFGLKGSASWAQPRKMLPFAVFKLVFNLLNILFWLLCQAAAKGVLKSCKLMFTLNTRLKRCKMSLRQKAEKPTPVARSSVTAF